MNNIVLHQSHYAPRYQENIEEYLENYEAVCGGGAYSPFLEELREKPNNYTHILIIQFHSSTRLVNKTNNPNPLVEWHEDKFAYTTVRYGDLYGWTYYIPVIPTGKYDSDQRPIYTDINGYNFVIDYHSGSPKYEPWVQIIDPKI